MGINVINVIKISVILNIISYNDIDVITKWKELAEKRRLVEQYYKERDKVIKDYKFRSDVSSEFYERVAKPVIKKIGEQIKKTRRTGREDSRTNAGASIAWTTNTSSACT